MKRRLTSAGLVLILVLGAASCGSDDKVDSTSTSTTSAGQESCRTGAEARSAGAPELAAPKEKTTELVTTDLIEGCGDAIPEGSVVTVEVNYLGKAHSTGEVFDSSFESGQTVSFPVGAGQLIQGWDQGLVGMKEGGRRQLLIPGDLAYGPTGNPPDIGPDDTLVFVIDLISVSAQ